jgi:hypothetical protein
MTDEEIEEAHEALEKLGEHDQEYLAEQLGGELGDYRYDSDSLCCIVRPQPLFSHGFWPPVVIPRPDRDSERVGDAGGTDLGASEGTEWHATAVENHVPARSPRQSAPHWSDQPPHVGESPTGVRSEKTPTDRDSERVRRRRRGVFRDGNRRAVETTINTVTPTTEMHVPGALAARVPPATPPARFVGLLITLGIREGVGEIRRFSVSPESFLTGSCERSEWVAETAMSAVGEHPTDRDSERVGGAGGGCPRVAFEALSTIQNLGNPPPKRTFRCARRESPAHFARGILPTSAPERCARPQKQPSYPTDGN